MASSLKQKAKKAKRKAKIFKEKAIQNSKHRIYSSFPGISRVRLPQSPVPHLLRSNIPPTDQEVVLISDAISIAEAEELRLKQEFTKRKDRHRRRDWDGLMAYKLQRATHFVVGHKAILSPTRRIPPEILQEIFIHALPPSKDDDHIFPWFCMDLPWNLSWVSHLWRTTALATSALWKRLPTIFVEHGYTKKGRYMDFLTEMLARSHDIPIDIDLNGPSFFDYKMEHPVLALLVTHSTRWGTLNLDLPWSTIAASMGSIKGCLPSLRVLRIQSLYGSAQDISIDIFEDAPLLHDVGLYGLASNGPVVVPFSQLTKYAISLFSSHGLPIFHFSRVSVPAPIITLPQMVVLAVGFDPIADFLDFLILPALEELSISSGTTRVIASVSSMISRSGNLSMLKKLHLSTSVAGTAGELTTLLRKTPLLTHLSVSLPPTEDLSSLISVNANTPVAPRLRICEFYIDDPVSDDEIHQLNLLASYRCELPDEPTGNIALPGELQRLLTIYLHFYNSELRHPEYHQGVLHGWAATDNTTPLLELRSLLDRHICEHPIGFQRRPVRKILDFKKEDDISSVLFAVEALKVAHAEEIFHSGIHLTLKRLSFGFGKKDPHKVSQSARRILQQWDPILKAGLKDLRWAIKETRFFSYRRSFRTSLMYLSPLSAVRSIKDSTNIVFGIEDTEIPPSDFPWSY